MNATQIIKDTMEAKEVVEITRSQLFAELFLRDKGSDVVTVLLCSEPSAMLKKSKYNADEKNPYWNKETKTLSIRCFGRYNGFIGVSYTSCVNRQLDREDKETGFEALETYYERIPGTCLVKHKKNDTVYLPIKLERYVGEPVYRNMEGEVIPYENIEKFFSDKKESEGRQGTDKKVEWRTFKVENIIGLNMNGVCYRVIADTVNIYENQFQNS